MHESWRLTALEPLPGRQNKDISKQPEQQEILKGKTHKETDWMAQVHPQN